MKYVHYPFLMLATAGLGAGLSAVAKAQESAPAQASGLVLEEVIVTARRREEILSDVPASISVFNQQQLDDANITNPGELATYTPSLQMNNRFGSDNATFAIRGFQQELRTTASVGVYFAEVVALRGANSQQSGDGATPGDFFDLANVQVLKGPTGTLFGRNTTGGAVLLTPQRPTDEFEGYAEGSLGNYDMWRGQAVLNIPVTDNFRLRLGIDHNERDGYLDNFSGIGPDDFANIDYTAYRVSALWDITDTLENYTILRYSDSDNNGYPGSLIDCNTEEFFGIICQADLDARIASGDDGFYDIYNFVPEPVNEQEMGQVINTLSWEMSDDYLLKYIAAFGYIETRQRGAIFGTNWQLAGADFIFQQVGLAENLKTTDQETMVHELQIQGDSLDSRLIWQAGLYYEKSEPGEPYGAQSPALLSCDQESITSADPEDFRCNDIISFGALQNTPAGVDYSNQAVYAQGTYDLSDYFSVTAGLRYTDDETEAEVSETIYYFSPTIPGQYVPYSRTLFEQRTPETQSDEVTWLLGLDYKPTDAMLIYGKYSRGYRQGSVNVGGSAGADVHDPEKVDTYEVGFKNTWVGSMPATLNVAAFYNDFTDQQLQFGYFKPTGVGTTAVVNAGASTIWGVEFDGSLQLTDNFILNASYAYLNTNVDDFEIPELPPGTIAPGFELSFTTAEGEPLGFAPENKLVLTGTWLLPVDPAAGNLSLSATYVYTDEMQATGEEFSKYATLPDFELVNFNFNWTAVFGSPVDISAFVTNATDEEYITYVSGLWTNGLETGQVGLPRMYGARVRYNFGI